ncbi:MAG: polyphosphate polymerase domain-containing protein [Lachnospiraceae bacterium]|nr:polyphosphate polymerase domain-containing protein [Lachnospiraceae bacterium]MBO5146866.1 polyphosphate polymerase domain-containing protein [Lachnospiraceae bacterium]
MKRYRNEWKYRVQEADLSVIENKVAAVMELDFHSGQSGNYEIHSLYFDDYKDTCTRENEAGISRRFKYRIRYYGKNPDILKLERKEKMDGRCYKESVLITKDTCCRILEGRVDELYWETDNPLLKEFYVHMMTRLFEPKAIIDYERAAYVEEIANVRITLDKNISVSDSTENFLSGDYLSYPIQEKKEHVLEVKFDDILPGYVKNVISNKNLQQSSFSKYYLGRLKLQEMRKYSR